MNLRSKVTLLAVVLSLSSLACVWVDDDPTANPSLTVHVSNPYGPVAGLKLEAMRPKDMELSSLIPDSIRALITFEKLTRVMESTTDSNGDAHFDLDRAGHWYIKADNAAGWWAGVYVDKQYQTSAIDLQYPHGRILETKLLRGRIRDSLLWAHGLPIKQGRLSLHTLVSFARTSSSTTKDDGTFEFDGVPPGIYLLGLNTDEPQASSYPSQPNGYIAVAIGPESPQDSLSIVVEESDCGFDYHSE